METHWIGLVLLSAVIHPVRDLTLKGTAYPMSCYIGVTLSWIAFTLIHALSTGQSLTLPVAAWPFVLTSASGLMLHYYGTLSALRRGNLSVYYPIVRASPVAIAAFSFLVLDRHYSMADLGGIFLVIVASLIGLGIVLITLA